MLLSSDKLVIMKIITCALVIIFIITRLSDDNITLLVCQRIQGFWIFFLRSILLSKAMSYPEI